MSGMRGVPSLKARPRTSSTATATISRSSSSHTTAVATPRGTDSGVLEMLSRLPLFRSASLDFLNTIQASMRHQPLDADRVVCAVGEVGDTMYFVLAGQVRIVGPDGDDWGTFSRGHHFGEISLLFGGRRNATARTIAPTLLGCLSRVSLNDALLRHNCEREIFSNAQNYQYVKQWFVRNLPLFSSCVRRAGSEFVDAIAAGLQYRSFEPHEPAVRRGEVGTEMFFVVHGTAEVISDTGAAVAIKEGGSVFGEIAMLYGEVRSATVRARTRCHMYVLRKRDFDSAMDAHPDWIDAIYSEAQEVQHLKEYFIKKIPLFADVQHNPEFVLNMSMALQSRSFPPGTEILTEGAYGSEMYFIARGTAVVESGGVEKAVFRESQFFGELSLLFRQRRTATVRAVTHCHLYQLTAEAFETMAVAFPEWWQSIQEKKLVEQRAQAAFGESDGHLNRVSSVHGLELPTVARRVSSSVDTTQQSGTSSPEMTGRTPAEMRAYIEDRDARLRAQARTPADELRELQNDKMCCVCFERTRCMLVVPCGHIPCCELCIAPLRACPLCRGEVAQTFKAVL
eukprot:gnl/Spiro4/4000_TR1991_c0_g2_i1.p1 gnl/Spiro4/4000_TR1991_c0_g2~~gnl/Spiro4/4000_TR1991_c0_g2_i1.p1  ORF type:complete len:567 (-),score=81.43 gnl/Spiro4/4000_TR1991_c0_g2_i1:195-1895(-)